MAARLMNRSVLSWALYDWANSAFALSVLATLYPLFLGSYWSDGAEGAAVTARLGFVNGTASIVVALLAPLLGAIADRGGARKRFLAFFALLGIVMTGGLYFVSKGDWPVALGLYAMASIGFYGGMVFYDSLLLNVAKPGDYERTSAFGFALGYIGSALLLSLNVWMYLSPATFGLADSETAVRLAFLLVAVWWLVFSLPVFLFVREEPQDPVPLRHAVAAGYRQLAATFREIRRYRHVFLFIVAFWLYIDGVHTVIQMATNFGQRLNFASSDLLLALLITNFAGFPATLFFGWLGGRIGPRNVIYIGLAVYVGVSIYAMFLTTVTQFYAMAITIGCVQGAVQSMSRAFFAQLVPSDKAAEFFGFYNMIGKFAAVIGPFLVAFAALASDSPKISIVVLLPLFVSGALLLSRVPPPRRDSATGRSP
ncbi:MAG: MFS transporter [Pseudomonadota bacterium]